MARPTAAKKIRLNLDLNEDVRKRLDDLRSRTEADSLGEVVRKALAVYDFLWAEREQGAELFVRGADQKEHRVVLL